MLVADYAPMRIPVAVENNAVGPEWEELRTTVKGALRNSVESSVFWNAAILYVKAQTQLYLLESLRSNWDTYGAPAPNDTAMGNAIRILEHMTPFDLSAAQIIPSAEGGI